MKKGCKEDRDRLFSVVFSDRTRGNGQKLKHRRLCLKHRETLPSLWGWPSSDKCCPERLWSLPPWRYSKAIWTWFWVWWL